MNWRTTLWLTAAALLLGLFILLVERPARLARAARTDLAPVLPHFDPDAVLTLEFRAASNSIVLDRTNGLWEIRSPERRTAQQSLVDGLLERLAGLRGSSILTTAELRARPSAAADFGLNPPLATLHLGTASGRTEILLGTRSLTDRHRRFTGEANAAR